MNARLISAVAVVALSGCAAQLVATGPRSVIVEAPDRLAGDAQRMAEAECQKHGRHARLANKFGDGRSKFSYDCIE